ncbi:MAG: DUF1292 domain-containing protein [Erysipelotrichaceae bacterium]|nr:DUF1292 domain-containing protein [Erysipelotrichaceae bacterium]
MDQILNDKQMIITLDNGEEVLLNILFTYENEARNKTYVFVYEDEHEDDVMAYIYDENSHSLSEIEDDDEYDEVEEVFNTFMNDENIQDALK